MVKISAGFLFSKKGVYLSLPMANNKGCTPAASTACTSFNPGISLETAEPVI